MELDPSLIEIAGEDDSLLQQIPTLDNYYFSCSPLQISGSNLKVNRARDSPIMVLKDNVNVEKSACSSAVGSSNKENINANKQEVPKLSVEPQQMKRKKRGGAYNLRKSLAWDRAFFTEEGVLNPLELSILSGSFSNSRSEVLPSIHEEQRNVSSNSFSTSDSAAMQGTPKMRSNRKSTRTGSKGGGCPRPLINSSLKRFANASTTKVPMKESKLPKLPVSRPSAHSLPVSSKSVIGTSHSKQNQICQEDIFQKSVGLQGSSKTLKSSTNKGNSGSDSSTMAAKSSCQPPRRNVANVALEVHSSTNPQRTLVTKAKCGLDVFPDAVLPRPGSRVPSSFHVSSKSGNATVKPSGLRMPSPSLGFFAQTNKSSASNSSSGKATPPSNLPESYTPSLQRFNTTNYARDSKLLHAREKIQNTGSNSTISGNSSVSDSSKECSVPCSGNDVSRENEKLKLEGNDELMKYQLVGDNQEVRNFIDTDNGFQECGEAHKNASSHKESDSNDTLKDTKMNDLENTNFAPQHSFVVLPKGDSGMNDTIKSQYIEDKPSRFEVGTRTVIFESVSEYAAGDTKQDLVIPHNDYSSAICDLDEYSRKKAQPLNASSGEADQILYGDNHNFVSDDGILLEGRNSFDSQRCQRENNANVNLSICETNISENISSKSSPRENAENESAAVLDPSNDKLYVEDVQVHFMDTANDCYDDKLCTSEVHDHHIECDNNSESSGESLKPPSCCLLVEQPFELNHGFLLHDISLLSEGTPAEEFHRVLSLDVVLNDVPEKGNYCGGCNQNRSNVLITQDPGATQVGGFAVHEMVEQPQEKAAFSSPSRMVSSVENCESYSDTQFGSDLSLKMSRDHLEVDTCDSIVCSLNKEEKTVAKVLKNNILAEDCNLTSNDGVLLEERNSFDSQRYQKENVSNVMLSIRETNNSEKPSSKSPPSESAVNESAPRVDPSNDRLQVEDVQVHFLDTTSLAKCCDYKLHILEVHDQDIECVDDGERSGQPLKPPSCCLLVEQPYELNHDFLLHDISLLSEGTPAEEFHGILGLEVALNDVPEKNNVCGCKPNQSNILITQDPGATQVAGVPVYEMVEQPQEKAAISSPSRMVSSVENYESYSDTQFGPDLSLKKSRDHLAVDTCFSIVCCPLIKEEERVAKINILAENCNLMSNDGVLLEGRNSFDSQRYQKENVANVMLSIHETNNSEKLSSKSLPSESAANESAPGVDPSNEKLHVEDVQVHFLDTISLAKCCDYKLHISEVHDQDIECHDDGERSGQPLKHPSCCLLVEQPSEVNHGFLLHDYSLLSEGTPAEEYYGLYGIEVAFNDVSEKNNGCGCKPNRSNILIAHDPGATQVGGVAVHEMVEQPQEKAALSSPSGMVSSVENCECYSNTQFRPDLSLKKSRDHLAVYTCDSIVCCSLSKEVTVASAFGNNILEENTETEFSSENPHGDNEITNVTGGILFLGSRSLGKFHSGDGGHSTDGSLLNQNCSGSELERSQSASLIEYTEQANEDTTGIVDKRINELCSAYTEVQSFDGNLLVGSSNSRHSNSTMYTHSVMVVADVNGQSNGLTGLQMPSLVVHNGFHYNHGLHLNDGKSTSSDEPQEEKVLAHIPFVKERNDGDCSESKTSSVAIQIPLSIQDSGVDMVGMPEHQPVEHAPSSSLDDETSTEYTNHSTDTILGNDMFSGQATSSESDLAMMIGDANQTVGEITNKAFCLREESGFSDQKIKTLANETDVVNLGVENVNAILLEDFGVEISQTNVSPTGEIQHKIDNAICLTEDQDRTMPIKKSRDVGKIHNLMVNPPIIAVPFSDEWLAVMEAAGEDVLTIKSGAVQNSPTDRSLPEPGPWSPVKRNHNEIGPFDCTKFNIPPPDSDALI